MHTAAPTYVRAWYTVRTVYRVHTTYVYILQLQYRRVAWNNQRAIIVVGAPSLYEAGLLSHRTLGQGGSRVHHNPEHVAVSLLRRWWIGHAAYL